jgi:hypothetical protein
MKTMGGVTPIYELMNEIVSKVRAIVDDVGLYD